MKDQLFVLRPGFDDRGTIYFCPYSAQIIGFLTYYPHVRDTLDLVELDFKKPRHPLVELVGEDHQAPPLLVLGEPPIAVADVVIASANGHRFIEKTHSILRYLAVTRNVPIPH